MAIRLLDGNEAERLCRQMNLDPELKLVSRDMTLNLALEIGDERRLIKIRDGVWQSIGRFVALSEPIDLTIKGPDEFWQQLLSPVPPPGFQNLYAGVRFAKCEVSGNGELYNAYYAAITRMIDVMRDFENG